MSRHTSYNTVGDDQYMPLFTETILSPENYELFDLAMPDAKLVQMMTKSLRESTEHWNKSPWNLKDTDTNNVKFFLGDQVPANSLLQDDPSGVDNRLLTATRAILSYATGQLAKPEITPSRSDEQYLRMARSMQMAMYQQASDDHVDIKVRAAVTNLVVRKRAFLKLRFDPNQGLYGDIVTEVVNPEDIIIDRHAAFMANPNVIHHRLRCTIQELISRFPKKAREIKLAYSVRHDDQPSTYVAYFEAWYSYLDPSSAPKEGVCWYIPEKDLILDKMPNPNWVYTGDDARDKQTNVMFVAPKPFVPFNYLNLGHSYIDETSLFDQAKPLQEMLNRRGRQFNANVDFMNGRWVGSKKAFSEEDGYKFVNKGARTMALVDTEDVNKAVTVLTPSTISPQVFDSMMDFRNEIDGIMGTPSVFKGAQPESQNTLGRDMLVKQQAGMLQDDLVRSVSQAMETYYKIQLQMMRVYYTDDYWFSVKGGDGKHDFIMLNGDNIDANVKIGVQVDSTLPLDKMSIRNTALELAKMNRIDQLTLLEDLGVPDPEIRTERFLRSQIDVMGYMQSVERGMDDSNAELDIMLLTSGKTPEERDNYDVDYFNYFNNFLTTNRFAMLPGDAKQRLVSFLSLVQHQAAQSVALQETMVNDAGIIEQPPVPPAPKKTINERLDGKLDPQDSQQIAGVQPSSPSPTQANPAAQTPQQAPRAAPAPPPRI